MEGVIYYRQLTLMWLACRECFPRIEQMVAFDVVIFMGYTSLMWLRTKVQIII